MRRVVKIFILFVGLFLVAGFVVSEKYAGRLGFSGGLDMITTIGTNYIEADISLADRVEITLEKSDWKHLSTKREEALARGMLVNEDDSYVPVSVKWNDEEATGEMRLKGHMLDHLEGDKWSFRIKLNGEDRCRGMKRFSLQHPGTRNYAYEWFFHEILRREGIIALQYDFISLSVNGKDLGVYALEEHFAEELLSSNNRPSGAILRFNPNLYWVGRLNNDLEETRIIEEFSKYQTAFLEPYDRGRVMKDENLLNNFLQAQLLLEEFRSGKKSTSEVFDVEKLAKYHAIIDLVGGYHSLDWSDIKYYLNDSTGKIEPVGYESFGVREIPRLAGMYNFIEEPRSTNIYHNVLFSDSTFFSAYIHELKRISNPGYLDRLLTETQDELNKKLSILNHEFPYKVFDPSLYYRNQKLIKTYMDLPKGVHGYFSDISSDSIALFLGAINSLPVEVTGLEIDGKIQEVRPILIKSKKQSALVDYKEYTIPLSSKAVKKYDKSSIIRVAWTLLGNDELKYSEIFNRPFLIKVNESPRGESLPFILLNESTKEGIIPKGTYFIDADYRVEGLNRLRISAGTRLIFKPGAKLWVECRTIFEGTQEKPIYITAPPVPGDFMVFNMSGKGVVRMRYAILTGSDQSGTLVQNGGKIYADNCLITSSQPILRLNKTFGSLSNLAFEDCNHSTIILDNAQVNLNGIRVCRSDDPVIEVLLGGVKVSSLYSRDSSNFLYMHAGALTGAKTDVELCELSDHVWIQEDVAP